ncbi:MAG: gliding motility-associated C-terminal domain-containing protein [Chitinophagaceae bacterium]
MRQSQQVAPSGLTYTYFTDAAATTTLANPNAIAASGIYYIKGTTAAGCFTVKPVTVTINPLPTVVITNPAGVCSPNTVDITTAAVTAGSSSGLTYTYYTDAVATTTLTNPNAVATSGTYYIKGTAATGCYTIKPVTVTINPLPTASISYAGTPFCATGTVSVTQTGQGGGTYSSTTGLSINASTGAIDLATSTAGTYTITYSFTNGTCSNATTTSVTINALPTVVITDPAAVCSPNTVDITDASITAGSTGGLTYTYFTDAAATNALANPNAVAASGTYYIKGITAAGCFTVKPVTVTINPLPTVVITNPAAVCSPNTVDITTAAVTAGSSSGLTYTYFTDAAATATLANPNAVAASGTYYIKGTAATGCYTIKPITVTINPLPTASISYAGTPYCASGTANVTQTGQGGGTYSSTTGLSINASTGVINLSTSTAGTYTVTYTFSDGNCSNTTTASVVIYPMPTATIAYTGTPYCASGTATVTRTGEPNGTYSSAAGLNIDVTTGAINLAASTPGSYVVFYNYSNGMCANVATTTVVINTPPTISVTNPPAICAPGKIDLTLSSVVTGTGTGISFAYYLDAAGLYSVPNPKAVGTPGLYYVKAVDVSHCESALMPILVSIFPQPSINTSGNAIICLGNSTVISATSPGSTLLWQGLGSNNSYTVAPTVTTDYIVTATNANGCQTTTGVKITVEDFSATLESNPDPVLSGTNVILKAGGNTNFSVLAWTPTSVFTNQTAITQSFIIQDTSLYSVVVKSQAGCIDTAYLKVMPEPNTQDFFMPNAFTPNGDGKNDIFKAYGLSIKEIELRVFNQWGQLLYETRNPAAGWNGYYKGSIQPAGPYVYTVKVTLYSGKTFAKKGTFSLIR